MSNIKLKNLIVEENLTLKNALKIIDLSGLEACFVTRKKKLLNIITDGDIRRALIRGHKLSDNIKKIKPKKNYIFVKENIAKYQLNIDINSKALKNKMIEVNTTLKFEDKEANEKKSHFEIVYVSIVKVNEDVIVSKASVACSPNMASEYPFLSAITAAS